MFVIDKFDFKPLVRPLVDPENLKELSEKISRSNEEGVGEYV